MTTPILHAPRATESQAAAYATSKGSSAYWVHLVPDFWRIAQRFGVDPAVAFGQSCKETGFGRFGGVIDASYCNPCGLKVRAGGGNYDPSAHARFKDWPTGITAFIHHLCVYAGAPDFPKAYPRDTPDPRQSAPKFGSARNVEDLGGKWAPNTAYGHEIVAMVNEMAGSIQEVTMAGDSKLASKFVQAKWRHTGGNLPPTRVVLHDMEYPLGKRGAEWCAEFFAGGSDGRPASANYCVDLDTVVQCVREADTAYHAPPNRYSLGIEHAGYSSMSRPAWLGPECLPELKLSAQLCADICWRNEIPVVFLAPQDLKADKRGITTHNNVSEAFRQSGHTDPGPNFPINQYLEWVKEAQMDQFNEMFQASINSGKGPVFDLFKAAFERRVDSTTGEKKLFPHGQIAENAARAACKKLGITLNDDGTEKG